MTPFLKTYSGTAGYVSLAASRTLFRGQMTASGGTITLRKTGQTATSVDLLATDPPMRFDGVDLSTIEFTGNTFSLKVSGVLLDGA